MRELRLLILCLIGAALLIFSTTATADDDDEPSVQAQDATEVTSSSARLRGRVDPNGDSTSYSFEYWTTNSYGTWTPIGSAGSGNSFRDVSALVEGLSPSTTYYFRLVAGNDEGTTSGSTRSFTTQAAPADPVDPADPTQPPATKMPDAAPPVQPQSDSAVGVAPQSGFVFIRRPGSSEFTSLKAGSELPYGSEVDAREGSLNLTSALPSGETQTGLFGAGRFVVKKGRRGYVNLHLQGPVCPRDSGRRAGAKGAVAAMASGRSGRRLWGRDSGGRFRTHGKNSHATVRGTRWTVSDSCAGTLTRVSEGSVVVRDRWTGKRKLLEAGERYLARPRR